MYFTIELFVEALILVLNSKAAVVIETVEKLIATYLEETKDSTYMENELFDFYINLIREVVALDISKDKKTDIESFLLKFRSSPLIIKSPDFYTTLRSVFTDPQSIGEDRIKYGLRKLNNCLLWYSNSKQIKKMFAKLSNVPTSTSLEKQDEVLKTITDLCSELIEMNNASNSMEDTDTRIFKLDMCDKDQLMKAVNAHKLITVTNVIRTGWQALNRSLGDRGGIALGEACMWNALSHHYKSGIIAKIARWTAQYNRPPAMIHNPLILFISLENEVAYILNSMFRELWINQYKTLPPVDITEEQIVNYCFDKMKEFGWHFIIERRLGTEFGFPQFVMMFEEYKKLGYTPVLCAIDYINVMSKNDKHSVLGNHLLIRELYNNLCNYLKSQSCCLVSGHQLSRHATEIIRASPMNPVKKFTMDCLADGMDPQREIDVAYYQHIERNQLGDAFLTMKIDKHRYVDDTPEKNKFFAMKFDPLLGILDDINGEDTSYQNIYAVTADDKDKEPDEEEVLVELKKITNDQPKEEKPNNTIPEAQEPLNLAPTQVSVFDTPSEEE